MILLCLPIISIMSFGRVISKFADRFDVQAYDPFEVVELERNDLPW